MSMRWTDKLPTEGGFYYWQNAALRQISLHAVRVVQVSKYKNREGFSAETLTRDTWPSAFFDCDLDKAPQGRWAGPLPQAY